MVPKEESISDTLSDRSGDPQGILGEFSTMSLGSASFKSLLQALFSPNSSSQQKRVHPVVWNRGLGNTITWRSCICSLQVAGLETALGTEHHWAMMLSLSLIPALTQYLVLPFCPESPRYLLINRSEESKAAAGGCHDSELFTQLIILNKPRMWILRRCWYCFCFLPAALQRLRGGTDKVLAELEEMKEEAAHTQGGVTIHQFFRKRRYKQPIIIVLIINLGSQLSGFNAVILPVC